MTEVIIVSIIFVIGITAYYASKYTKKKLENDSFNERDKINKRSEEEWSELDKDLRRKRKLLIDKFYRKLRDSGHFESKKPK